MQPRTCYTREQLLALRDALCLDSFPNLIKPDCPMLTDCELELHETKVTKRQKGDKPTRINIAKVVSTPNGFGECLESGRGSGDSPDQRKGFGECVGLGGKSRTSYGSSAGAEGPRRSIVPPGLRVPVVTISGPGRVQPTRGSGLSDGFQESFDTERWMVSRLRELQERRRHEPHQIPGGCYPSPSFSARKVADSRVAAGPGVQPTSASCSRGGSVTLAVPTEGGGCNTCRSGPEAAVPMANVSLFKSTVGSRYFQFTRTLGLWEYLTTHGGLGPLSGATQAERKEGSADGNNSHSGVESSVGPDELTSPSAPRQEGEGGSEKIVVVMKKSHKRRTNRTHAEKRAYRDAQQGLSEGADNRKKM